MTEAEQGQPGGMDMREGEQGEDREGMAGQLDDSTNALDDEDDTGEASRGIPQE
jgi:hypothetical protein